MTYGIMAWGNGDVVKIANMQTKIVRIINNKGYTAHTDPLLKKSEILKLKDLYECEVSLFMHSLVPWSATRVATLAKMVTQVTAKFAR